MHSTTAESEPTASDRLSEGQDACQNFGNDGKEDAAQISGTKIPENEKRWKPEARRAENFGRGEGQDYAENFGYAERQDAAQILAAEVSGNQERWKIEAERKKKEEEEKTRKDLEKPDEKKKEKRFREKRAEILFKKSLKSFILRMLRDSPV